MQLRVCVERALHDVISALFDEGIRGDDEAANAVASDEEVNNFGGVVAQRGLATREPEVCDGRHRGGDLFYLREGEVARAVQLLVVKAGLTLRVATRGDEEDDRAEPLL